jgi:murein DD-endopeptidase MepM/ murein hydrolase activator NlpD
MSTSQQPKGDVVTFMYVPGRTGQIKRMHFARVWIHRGIAAACAAFLLLAGLFVDYARVRYQLSELDYLRDQTRQQAHQLDEYTDQMQQISESLKRVSSFDRKLRVITNLDPADPLPLPGIGGVEGELVELDQLTGLSRDRRHRRIMEGLGNLSEAAGAEAESLAALIAHLEDQTAQLRATPSIAPTKGWVTSGFGHRSSPFTANREFHRGLDIAGRPGTPVFAPADGVVRFSGHRRALGNSVSMRHGYGVSTIYGHMNELTVKAGQKVARGEQIGTLGSTGRSTGPHLHYQVQVNGQPVDPRNYILD